MNEKVREREQKLYHRNQQNNNGIEEMLCSLVGKTRTKKDPSRATTGCCTERETTVTFRALLSGCGPTPYWRLPPKLRVWKVMREGPRPMENTLHPLKGHKQSLRPWIDDYHLNRRKRSTAYRSLGKLRPLCRAATLRSDLKN